MSKILEDLKKIVENKSAAIQSEVKLLDDFHSKADPKTQQFIDILLQFHTALHDKTIKDMSVSISAGKIISDQAFSSLLQSIVRNPSLAITNYKKQEPILTIRDRFDSIVSFNLTDIEVVLIKNEQVNGKSFCFIQLHSKHNKIDYSIIITKEEK